MLSGSRLFVKNLPKITEERLRSVFSQKGRVTDVQLKFDKNGKFRHFGFIGFSSPEEAEMALQYFNSTFIGGSKISVEPCRDFLEGRHLQNRNTRIMKTEEAVNVKATSASKRQFEGGQDPEFQEFLSLHLSKRKKQNIMMKPEEDDDVEKDEIKRTVNTEAVAETVPKSAESPSKNPKMSVRGTIQYEVKLRNLPCRVKKRDLRAFFLPLKLTSLRIPPKSKGISGIAYAGFGSEKDLSKALLKSKSILQGRPIQVYRFNRKEDSGTAGTEGGSREKRWAEQEELLKTTEAIGESGRIFVRNLSYDVTEEDIENLFSQYGALTETLLPINRTTRKSMGIAFVTFMFPEHAEKAYQTLDGTSFQGRLLHLLPSQAPKRSIGGGENEGMTYKQKQALKAKAEASKSVHQWNTLFLGPNAVAEVVATEYDSSKQTVLSLERGRETAAVRLALGEAEIVAKTRSFLEENGVSLDAFTKPYTKRSKTAFLIKNLPAGTVARELMSVLTAYGAVGRVVLPHSGVTALVEFFEASEARAAFQGLAYTKFKKVPLYLEWAPEDVFTRPVTCQPTEDTAVDEAAPADVEASPEDKELVVEETELEPEEGTMLFVKNLNFDTTDESLRSHFSQVGRIHSALVSRRKASSGPGLLSNGYGFVQYHKKKDAEKALRSLQRSSLDGHPIEIKPSHRTAGNLRNKVPVVRKAVSSTQAVSPKIIVRNVPFQASVKEIRDLFKTFGELRAVRLPSKVGGSHRGFAFVEFATQSDAKKAFQAMVHSTHLYGRRLVLEWAKAEESLDDLRRKTASKFVGMTESVSGKKQFQKLEETLQQTSAVGDF